MRKRKYKPGDVITSLDEMAAQELVYWRESIVNRGWFQNWQISFTQYQLYAKLIRKAIRIEEE